MNTMEQNITIGDFALNPNITSPLPFFNLLRMVAVYDGRPLLEARNVAYCHEKADRLRVLARMHGIDLENRRGYFVAEQYYNMGKEWN